LGRRDDVAPVNERRLCIAVVAIGIVLTIGSFW
jgi:hypothetical protein